MDDRDHDHDGMMVPMFGFGRSWAGKVCEIVIAADSQGTSRLRIFSTVTGRIDVVTARDQGQGERARYSHLYAYRKGYVSRYVALCNARTGWTPLQAEPT